MYAAVSAAWNWKLAGDQDAFERVAAFAEIDTYEVIKLYGCNTLVDT
jgi:hypothetical protein